MRKPDEHRRTRLFPLGCLIAATLAVLLVAWRSVRRTEYRKPRLIVVTHHKSGTVAAFQLLAAACCPDLNNATNVWAVWNGASGGSLGRIAGCRQRCAARGIYFASQGLRPGVAGAELLDRRGAASGHGGGTIVHMLRHPIDMIVSGYLYHRRCEESWTRLGVHTWDDRWFGPPSAHEALLRLFGVPRVMPQGLSYCEMLRRSNASVGVSVEAMRTFSASFGARQMLTQHAALQRGSAGPDATLGGDDVRVINVCLHDVSQHLQLLQLFFKFLRTRIYTSQTQIGSFAASQASPVCQILCSLAFASVLVVFQ